ncbi:flagellar hook-length control protein FliK [Sphingomonas sp.]|uniref:flagellar hook-length control protein FliK n=1 Tax=Sphingomonas sp. TaxID=28214 RepID=UPI001EB678ED|nr:flagellar hook-length control protein FliK [Sphingomonas sp.]MBX3595295.1 flagellar hook-length control protein FliK [Sphingomonas sp.]
MPDLLSTTALPSLMPAFPPRGAPGALPGAADFARALIGLTAPATDVVTPSGRKEAAATGKMLPAAARDGEGEAEGDDGGDGEPLLAWMPGGVALPVDPASPDIAAGDGAVLPDTPPGAHARRPVMATPAADAAVVEAMPGATGVIPETTTPASSVEVAPRTMGTGDPAPTAPIAIPGAGRTVPYAAPDGRDALSPATTAPDDVKRAPEPIGGVRAVAAAPTDVPVAVARVGVVSDAGISTVVPAQAAPSIPSAPPLSIDAPRTKIDPRERSAPASQAAFPTLSLASEMPDPIGPVQPDEIAADAPVASTPKRSDTATSRAPHAAIAADAMSVAAIPSVPTGVVAPPSDRAEPGSAALIRIAGAADSRALPVTHPLAEPSAPVEGGLAGARAATASHGPVAPAPVAAPTLPSGDAVDAGSAPVSLPARGHDAATPATAPTAATDDGLATTPVERAGVTAAQAQPLPTPAIAPAIAPAMPAAPVAAVHAFAAAILAAQRDGDTDTPGFVEPSLRAAEMVASDQLRTTVQAKAGVDQAPLDLTRDDWGGKMIDRIAALRDAAEAADTRIRLAPENLGNVDVSIRRDGDRLHVHFNAENAATRQLLAEAAPRLTELADARGVKLGQTSVGGEGGQSHARQQGEPGAPARPRTVSAAVSDEGAPADDRIA